MKAIIILLLMVSIAGLVHAQTITIKGSAVDMTQSATPLKDFTVRLEGKATLSTKSDAYNIFEFQQVPLGSYKLIIVADGFKRYEKDLIIPDEATAHRDYSFLVVMMAGNGSTMRAVQVDYTEYDRINLTLYTSKDRVRSTEQLLKVVDETFKPTDEEYFYAYYNAAILYRLEGHYKEAIACTNIAIEAYEKNFPFTTRHSVPMVSRQMADYSYYQLGSLYTDAKLFESACAYFESKRNLFLENPSKQVRNIYFMSLGLAYVYSGQYDKALHMAREYRKVLDSREPVADLIQSDPMTEEIKRTNERTEKYTREMVVMQCSLIESLAYFYQYNWEKLAENQKSYMEAYGSIMASVKESMEEAAKGLDDPAIHDSVRQQFQRSQQFTNAAVGGRNMMAVLANCKINQPETARKLIGDDVDRVVYSLLVKDFATAERLLQNQEARLKEFENDQEYAPSVKALRQNYLQYWVRIKAVQKKYDEALAYEKIILGDVEQKFRNGFSFLTENEKKELQQDYSKQLDFYYSLLLQASEADKTTALDVLNKSLQTKGLILEYTKKQSEKLQGITDPALKEMIAKIKGLRNKQSSFNETRKTDPDPKWNDSILVNGKRISDLEKAINQRLGTTEDFFTPVQWQDVQKKLQPNDFFVDIVRVGRDNFLYDRAKIQYWAFVIRAGTEQPEYFLLSEDEAFENRNLRLYQNKIRAVLDDVESYPVYWQKIGIATATAQRMYLSSDGVYHLMNPVTLKNPLTGKFVWQETEVVRISSGRDLLGSAKSARPSATTATLIGNPDFTMSRRGTSVRAASAIAPTDYNLPGQATRSGFSELPGTERELELIAEHSVKRGLTVTSLEGKEANEATIKKLVSPSVLHFATHGTFDNIQDETDGYLKSKLVLAGAADPEPLSFADYLKYEDGFLTGYEVTQLNLANTALTVLSACETGLGDLQSGEGVWGLQRAFQLAGSNAVMGSLWKINDETTVLFMNLFYEKWLSGASLHAAYRHAILKTSEKHSHPYYWGAFVLLGN